MSLAWVVLLALQAHPLEPPVEKAVLYVRNQELKEFGLWTLISVGLTDKDPVVQRLLNEMLARPVESTPTVALQAMILRDLDPVRYRNRIAQCAQFFVDTQAADGRWGAGKAVDPIDVPGLPPQAERPRDFGLPPLRPPGIPPRLAVKLEKRGDGPMDGDSVNSRWAAWGLLACREAGFLAPDAVLEKATASWRTGKADAADALTSLCVHLHLQGRDWRKDADVLKEVQRLSEPGRPTDPMSLFLRKRAMVHFGIEILVGREWWNEGAKILAASQRPDGSWDGVDATCAAIQYLHIPKRDPMWREGRR